MEAPGFGMSTTSAPSDKMASIQLYGATDSNKDAHLMRPVNEAWELNKIANNMKLRIYVF